VVGIGPFTMKNVNIRANGLQTKITTQENHKANIYNGEIPRLNKNIFPLLDIGEFSLKNVDIKVNLTTPTTQIIQTKTRGIARSLNQPFSNSNFVSRLSTMLDSILLPQQRG